MKITPFIICLMGPTASGKTQLAIEITQQFPCEIVSVDSAMIYRGMDIGTAKPSLKEQSLAPHRLIDICDPAQTYSAGQFRKDALREIAAIHANNKIPLLVGGTLLYFHRLRTGLANLPTANREIRDQIQNEAETLGWPAIHEQLNRVDPQAAQRIHPNDSQRIQRALEIYRLTGSSITQLHLEDESQAIPYETINIILAPEDRISLHQRIEKRVDQMLEMGLLEEVIKLYRRGDLHADLPSIRAVNYRQMWAHLAGEYDFETARERCIIATRQLAKRQFTWLRTWQNAQWFNSEDPSIIKIVLNYLRDNWR